MASLKCSKCGRGIHYHDEPNGTEWIVFELKTWEKLLSSQKELSSYKSDTNSGWYSIWKCSECGTLHVFKTNEIHLYKAFEYTDNIFCEKDKGEKCIAFEDLVWDQITETEETGNVFDGPFKEVPRAYIIIYDKSIVVFSNEEYERPEKQYKLIDIQN